MTRKNQERFPADDVEASELETLCKELGERVGELGAIVKLAKVCPDVEESVRQIARLGIRASELSDRVKTFAKRLNLESAV